MKYLLDTCTFLWIMTDDVKLSPKAKDLFFTASNEIFLSAISVWEMLVKHGLGRLTFADDPHRVITENCVRYRIAPLAFDDASAFLLPTLPAIHQDPFDRMLICQALAHNLTLMTPDSAIAQYPVPTVW